MVAGAMALLGIAMSQSAISSPDNDFNGEDLDFISAFQARPIVRINDTNWGLGETQQIDYSVRCEQLTSLVRVRNHAKEVWGFKDPSSYMYLDDIRETILNPHLIVIYRDFFAVAEREYVTNTFPLEQGLEAALDRFTKIQRLALSWKSPTLFVSFERSQSMKSAFVRQLASFLQISPTPEMKMEALRFISGRSYKSARASAIQ